MTQADLRSMAGRMLDHEANLLWVGHNNPGEVEIGKWEPTLSYAVSRKVELTLDDRLECSYGRFWQRCFGLEKPSGVYIVSNAGRELVYNISSRESAIAPAPNEVRDFRLFDRHGDQRAHILASDAGAVRLAHHEIALAGVEL